MSERRVRLEVSKTENVENSRAELRLRLTPVICRYVEHEILKRPRYWLALAFSDVDIATLKHEAQFYGVHPLVKRLALCEELDSNVCGGILFHGYLPPPLLTANKGAERSGRPAHVRNRSEPPLLPSATLRRSGRSSASAHVQEWRSRDISGPGHSLPCRSLVAGDFLLPSQPQHATTSGAHSVGHRPKHARANSVDFKCRGAKPPLLPKPSLSDIQARKREMTLGVVNSSEVPNLYEVKAICGTHSWIAVAYQQHVVCHRIKESLGWQRCYVSRPLPSPITLLAITSKSQAEKYLAVAVVEEHSIFLWLVNELGNDDLIGTFSLRKDPVDSLFFISSQLVGLSHCGKVGIWRNSISPNWQVQEVVPISSYDTAGSILLLGCVNGSIYCIDMQKFPLRMKDNDLLVTDLYRDPACDVITAISVYLTPKSNMCGNWVEIAYGTASGYVRVIVQHPETVGHGPQLFQTFSVHRAPITQVSLTTNYLISVCSEYNHVRTWAVTRFRGMINTQPGSTPLGSFNVVALDTADDPLESSADVGPFGEQDDEQVFVQKVVPLSSRLFVRLACNGARLCDLRSVDGSPVSAFVVHDCEGSSRIGSRARKYLFTGHVNGSVQMWDLSTALDRYYQLAAPASGSTHNQPGNGNGGPSASVALRLRNAQNGDGGPTPAELVELLANLDITSAAPTPASSMYSLNSCHK